MKLWQEQNVTVSLPPKEYEGVKITVRRCGTGEFVPLKEPTLWRLCRKFSIVSGSSFVSLEKQIAKVTGKKLMSLQDILVKCALSIPFYIEVICDQEKDEELFARQFMSFYPNQNVRLTDNIVCTDSIISLCKLFYIFKSFKPQFHIKKRKFPSVLTNVASSVLVIDGTCIESSKVKKNDFSGKNISVCGINSVARMEELIEWGAKHIVTTPSINLARRTKDLDSSE